MCLEKRCPPPQAATSRQKIPLLDTLLQGPHPVNEQAENIQSNQELRGDLQNRSEKNILKNNNLQEALKVMLDHAHPADVDLAQDNGQADAVV
jgi:hypothetical protein